MYALIDGKKLAQEMRVEIKSGVDGFTRKNGREIGLAVRACGRRPRVTGLRS